MSYTGCEFHGKYAQVDGTSYACVIAIALNEAVARECDKTRKSQWAEKLAKHQENANTYPTNMIGGDLGEFIDWDTDAEKTFRESLHLAKEKINSFEGQLPSDFLRDAIGQEGTGYIQDGAYDSTPFVKTIGTLRNLLDGIESY